MTDKYIITSSIIFGLMIIFMMKWDQTKNAIIDLPIQIPVLESYVRRKNMSLVHHFLLHNTIDSSLVDWNVKIIRAMPCEKVSSGISGQEGPDQMRIRAVWSGPSFSANKIIGYYRM